MILGRTIFTARAGVAFVFALVLTQVRALAIPEFAHQYGVTCQKCHTVVPHLNDFGLHFAAAGDRIPLLQAGPAVPISVKVNLVYSSAYQGTGPNGAGLPRAIVDEVELLASHPVGNRGSYFIEQYAVDGGEHGLLREAWFDYRADPWTSRVPVSLQAGSMTLPVPVDPETFRESYRHFTLFDQTVGDNPFNFFDPKIGGKLSIGDTLHGANVQLFAGPGHDRQSGLQTTGTDVMGYIQHVLGALTLSAYRYEGMRPDGALLNRFERTGYAAVLLDGRWESDSVLQTGHDSSIGGIGQSSSGGFEQIRYSFNARLFTLVRYEGTSDHRSPARDAVLLLGYRPDRCSRVTLEDVITHAPRTQHTMNLQYTVAH